MCRTSIPDCVSAVMNLNVVVLLVSQVKQAVNWALEAGYRHIDCAAIYGNEVEIGEALQESLGPGKVKQLTLEAQSWSKKHFQIVLFSSDFVSTFISLTSWDFNTRTVP